MSETETKPDECVFCDRVWLAAGVLAAIAVGFIAFDMVTAGKVSAWLGQRITPKLGQLHLINGDTPGESDDGDAA